MEIDKEDDIYIKHITDWIEKKIKGPYDDEKTSENKVYKIPFYDGTEIILYVNKTGVDTYIIEKKSIHGEKKRKFDEMNTRDSGKKQKSVKRRKSIKRSLNRKSIKRSLNRKSVYAKNELDNLIGLRCIQKMTLKNGKSYIGSFGSKEYFSSKKYISKSGIYGIKDNNKLILAKLEDIIKVSTC